MAKKKNTVPLEGKLESHLEWVETELAKVKSAVCVDEDQLDGIHSELKRVEETDSIETDHQKKDQRRTVELDQTTKTVLVHLVEVGLYIKAQFGKPKMEEIVVWGRFLTHVKNEIFDRHGLRLFSWLCKKCGFSRQAGYNYMKLYKNYGDELPEFARIDEKKLLTCCLHEGDVRDFVRQKRDEILELPIEKVKILAKPTYRPRSSSRKRQPSIEREPQWQEIDGTRFRKQVIEHEVELGTFRVTLDGLSSMDLQAIERTLKYRDSDTEFQEAECKTVLHLPTVDHAIMQAHEELPVQESDGVEVEAEEPKDDSPAIPDGLWEVGQAEDEWYDSRRRDNPEDWREHADLWKQEKPKNIDELVDLVENWDSRRLDGMPEEPSIPAVVDYAVNTGLVEGLTG